MKIFLYLMLVLHVVLEGGYGAFAAFSPTSAAPNADEESIELIINFGCAAIAIAIAVLWLWPQRNNLAVLNVVLGILATFHTAQVLAGILVISRGGGFNIIITHGLLAIGFWVLWFCRASLTSTQRELD